MTVCMGLCCPLDLKPGYWQVEMEEEREPLTTFMVGTLGFSYEHTIMSFGLTNALGNLPALDGKMPG